MHIFTKATWLALVASTILCAQSDLASVTGEVIDSSKAVMVGVTVAIRNTEHEHLAFHSYQSGRLLYYHRVAAGLVRAHCVEARIRDLSRIEHRARNR